MSRASRPVIALVTARAARKLDEDLAPLAAALAAAGAQVHCVDWDDDDVNWRAFDLGLLRSPWDYTKRLPEFLDWAQRVSQMTTLLNPAEVIRWNVDKHYLAQLARAGAATVPGEFIELGENPAHALAGFLARHAAAEFVVKPCVGAGSRDAQRYARTEDAAAAAHAQRLLDAGRSVLLQPYLDRVDQAGETALIYFEGEFSHAIRKGPLLKRGQAPTRALFAEEHITAREPQPDEFQTAEKALAATPWGTLLYARVDLIRDAAGLPCVLELELTEPSLFFSRAGGAVERFAAAILRRVRSLA